MRFRILRGGKKSPCCQIACYPSTGGPLRTSDCAAGPPRQRPIGEITVGPRGSSRRLVLALAAMACAVLVAGCADCRWRVDPTGERVFVAEPVGPAYKEVPAGQASFDPVAVIVAPRVTVAPVGGEVILLAGVVGPDGQYFRMDERVEWTISPGSVGEFVDLDKGSIWNLFLGDFTFPRKLSSTHAVGTTSRKDLRLTRGAPDPADHVLVGRGQTWIAVSSPMEGSTYVTAYAHEVYGWDRHKQDAVIYWVDARAEFPSPAIVAPGGRHMLTTTVRRQSDGSPAVGYRVRYTIGDAATGDLPTPAIPSGRGVAVAPGGAQSVEIETNAAGQASVEVSQPQAVAGTTRVDIQVIRPSQPAAPAGPGATAGIVVERQFDADYVVHPGGPGRGHAAADLCPAARLHTAGLARRGDAAGQRPDRRPATGVRRREGGVHHRRRESRPNAGQRTDDRRHVRSRAGQ